LGAALAEGQANFLSWCGFMLGLSKPKLCTKFELPSFSHCVNIEVEHQNIGELPSPRPSLSSGCDFMMGFGKPKLCTKFEVTSFSHCVNIAEEPQILGNSPSPGPRRTPALSSTCDFIMGFGKP